MSERQDDDRDGTRAGHGRTEAASGFPPVLDADRRLLDQRLLDVDGIEVGTVDDLEFGDPVTPGAPVELTALLCGPAALGPRIGGRLGVWWGLIGLRLRGTPDEGPVRIPVGVVARAEAAGLRLHARRDAVPTGSFASWARDTVVARIPGARS